MSETSSEARQTPDEGDERPREELVTELQLLREQHEQLRESYVRGRQTRYTRTAIGFAALGVLAVGGGLILPETAGVLFALGGVGLFGALLVGFLTPEGFIAADVGRDVYAALANNQEAATAELGLSDERRYVPPSRAGGAVRLFVPEHETTALPPAEALASLFVVGEQDAPRGLALEPTGARLYRSFQQAASAGGSTDPAQLATQLGDALVEQFEIVDAASPDVDSAGGRVTLAVTGSAYGPVDRLDHPVASFVAVGLVRALDAVVTLEVDEADDEAEYLVTCRWDSDAVDGEGTGESEA